jgi:hypothetical protein
MVSFIEIKKRALERFPEDSVFRRLVLAERDYVPELEAVTKIEMYGRLLHEETRTVT